MTVMKTMTSEDYDITYIRADVIAKMSSEEVDKYDQLNPDSDKDTKD